MLEKEFYGVWKELRSLSKNFNQEITKILPVCLGHRKLYRGKLQSIWAEVIWQLRLYARLPTRPWITISLYQKSKRESKHGLLHSGEVYVAASKLETAFSRNSQTELE